MKTVAEVAEILNVSSKTVYKLLREDLEHYRIGNLIRIDDVQLAAYLAARKRKEEGAIAPPPRRRVPKLKHLDL